MTLSNRELVQQQIAAERRKQTLLWSPYDQRHPFGMWMALLAIRVGKLGEALIDPSDSAAVRRPDELTNPERAEINRRAVQLAAVAAAIAELTA